MLESIESAAYNQDDIITWGETLDELQNWKIEFFEPIRKQDLRLSKKK